MKETAEIQISASAELNKKSNNKKNLKMALENLISVSFTPAELTAIDNALTAIEGVINGKLINLKPEERRRYSCVADEMENWISKTKDYMLQKPALVPAYINMAEVQKDYDARKAITPRLNRLQAINDMFSDSNLLIGSDLYHNMIAYYRTLKVNAKNDAPGAKTIYADLSTQFPGGGKPKVKPAQ